MNDLLEAYSDAYMYLYENDLVSNPTDYINRLNDSFAKNDIEQIEAIYDELHLSKSKISLSWYKYKILKSVGCYISEIESILNTINTEKEADIVLDCITGSSWINLLPNKKISKYTYSKQIKHQRRLLEKALKEETNTGINRAKKISQILDSL